MSLHQIGYDLSPTLTTVRSSFVWLLIGLARIARQQVLLSSDVLLTRTSIVISNMRRPGKCAGGGLQSRVILSFAGGWGEVLVDKMVGDDVHFDPGG